MRIAGRRSPSPSSSGARRVAVTGWMYRLSTDRWVVGPDRPGVDSRPCQDRGSIRGLTWSGAEPPDDAARVHVVGELRGSELTVGHWEVEKPGVRPSGRMQAEYANLRARAVMLLAGGSAARCLAADLEGWVAGLGDDPRVTAVHRIAVRETTVYSVVSTAVESLAREVAALDCGARVLLSDARWSAEDVDRAERIIEALPDAEIVSVAGGVAANGDDMWHVVVFDQHPDLARAVARLPEGLLVVDSWITAV